MLKTLLMFVADRNDDLGIWDPKLRCAEAGSAGRFAASARRALAAFLDRNAR